MKPLIPSWSYSRLLDFEKCPFMIFLKVVERVPEPKSPYSERGTAVHKAGEDFVKGETPTLSEDFADFGTEMESLRRYYDEGRAIVEQEWAFDREWKPCDWRDDKRAWLRVKLDTMVRLDKATAAVIDWKTGKKFGNEIKHAEQGQLYAGVTFLRQPELGRVYTEFWYLDQNDLTPVTYMPAQAAKFLSGFEKRALKMTGATTFKPTPSIFSCKWCPYRPESVGGNGACKHGVGNIGVSKRQWK